MTLTSTDTGLSADAQEIMARTIWGEARGEGAAGMIAVACVILNRAARPGWWGHDVVSVCLKRRQFSCWNADDPNRSKLLAVGEDDPQYRLALDVARRALAGELQDPTGGATHYHVKNIMPYWARAEEPVATIGNHMFYKGP